MKASIPRSFSLILLMTIAVRLPAQGHSVEPPPKETEDLDKVSDPSSPHKGAGEVDRDARIWELEKYEHHLRTEDAVSPLSSEETTAFTRHVPVPLVVQWKRENGKYMWRVNIRDTDFYKGQLEGTSLNLEGLQGADFIHVGDIPYGPNWKKFLRRAPSAIHLAGSVNESTQELVHATELASIPFNPQNTVIFNALPYEKTLPRRQLELLRMGVSTRSAAWQDLNRKIDDAQDGLSRVGVNTSYSQAYATRKNLLDELASGTSNMLLIYLHFDGRDLYLPGLLGGKIGVAEIEAIRRSPEVANRVIVLVSCNGALDSAENKSLASIFLENGIARTVLATDELYPAENIPALVKGLLSGKSVRSSAVGLQQYVELRSAPSIWEQVSGSHQ